MNRFLISIGLIIYISALVNCNDLNIENICEEDIFTLPNGLKVNAISRYQVNRTFNRLSLYFMDQYVNLNRIFKTNEKANEANEIRKSFNNIVNEIYSEYSYLNDNQLFKDNLKRDLILIEEILKKTNNLKEHLKQNNDQLFSIYMLSPIVNAYQLLISLNTIRKNKWELNDDNFKIFNYKIYYLKRDIKEKNLHQITYALENVQNFEIFVNYELIQKDKFVFNLNEKGRADSTGTMVFDLCIPLNNKNYNFEKKKGCIKVNSLPAYFRNKK